MKTNEKIESIFSNTYYSAVLGRNVIDRNIPKGYKMKALFAPKSLYNKDYTLSKIYQNDPKN